MWHSPSHPLEQGACSGMLRRSLRPAPHPGAEAPAVLSCQWVSQPLSYTSAFPSAPSVKLSMEQVMDFRVHECGKNSQACPRAHRSKYTASCTQLKPSLCTCAYLYIHIYTSQACLCSPGTPSLSTDSAVALLRDATGALLPDQDGKTRRERGRGQRSSCARFRGRAGGHGPCPRGFEPFRGRWLAPSSAGAERGGERSGPAEPRPRRAAGTAGRSRDLTAGPFRSPGV